MQCQQSLTPSLLLTQKSKTLLLFFDNAFEGQRFPVKYLIKQRQNLDKRYWLYQSAGLNNRDKALAKKNQFL